MVTKITYNGETLPISEWAKKLGLDRMAIYRRLHNGWSIEDAVSIPARRRHKKYLYKGVSLRFDELCAISEVSPAALCKRLERGWTVEEAVVKELPEHKRPKVCSECGTVKYPKKAQRLKAALDKASEDL